MTKIIYSVTLYRAIILIYPVASGVNQVTLDYMWQVGVFP